MKKTLSLALALSLLLLLTACGASSSSTDSSTMDVSYNSSASSADMQYGWAEADEAPVEMGTSAGNSALANTKIIYTADMNLETKEFDSACQALDQIVASLGGYYESRSLYQGSSYRNLSCTIRIPAEQFSEFLNQAGQIAHVTNKNEYKDDISEAYYDNEARLTTQQTKLERLHTLLEQAATMEDIIALETAISETELQIEYLTGSLRKYDSLVNFSTITLYLQEVYRLSSDEEPATTFGQRLGSALSTGLNRGIEGLEEFVIGIARNWVTLLFLLVVLAVVILVVRHRRRRKQMPPPSAQASDNKPQA